MCIHLTNVINKGSVSNLWGKKKGGSKFLFPIVHNEDENLMEKLNAITPLVHKIFKKKNCMECKF
jgi:hypothetical protein